jgi:hypothetical protein
MRFIVLRVFLPYQRRVDSAYWQVKSPAELPTRRGKLHHQPIFHPIILTAKSPFIKPAPTKEPRRWSGLFCWGFKKTG